MGSSQGWKGTILLAPEGINGTIAAKPAEIKTLHNLLQADDRFRWLDWKESQVDFVPFQRFKVKLKDEVISLGHPNLDPLSQGGIHVSPTDWNHLITDPKVLVLDTRNDFEVELGTFSGSVNPHLKTFRDFPAYVAQHLDPQQHSKIAMFCTGGIRCEKASALLKAQGFGQVYQLQGGILNYLATVPKTEHLWEGECFVFDDRVTVTADLQPGSYQIEGDRVIPKMPDSAENNH